MRRWDAVLVNQYLCELREAKKQGRKEKRHKEAQAVLAAATAAAAASSRISSFRKDSLEESASQEVFILSLLCFPYLVIFFPWIASVLSFWILFISVFVALFVPSRTS